MSKTLPTVKLIYRCALSIILVIIIHSREVQAFVSTQSLGAKDNAINSPLFHVQKNPPTLKPNIQTTTLPNLRLNSKRKPQQRSTAPTFLASTSKQPEEASTADSAKSPSLFKLISSLFSQTIAFNVKHPDGYYKIQNEADRFRVQLVTLVRVGIPSLLAGVVSTLAFPALSLFLASIMNDAGVFQVLSQDSSQFVQNFLTVSGLLFSILVGQTYYFMYQQQEAVYYALFNEVTEAKSLVEQVALVCQGRAMYSQVLKNIQQYVSNDLRRLQSDPAELLSARPIDDPLESVMYMTSVGVPSTVYETVRSLRQARAGRLGALQRKLPQVHMVLLWLLGLIELVSFPLLGAGTQTIGGYRILTVEGVLFGVMTFGIVMTLRVVGELWRPAGGAYNVDGVLSVMVSGLEEELDARMSGGKLYTASRKMPSTPMDNVINSKNQDVITTDGTDSGDAERENDVVSKKTTIQQQGGDVFVGSWKLMKRIRSWILQKS